MSPLGTFSPEVFWPGGLLAGGIFVQGCFCPGVFCPGDFFPGGLLPGGTFGRGTFGRGIFVRGCFCPGGLLPGGTFPRGSFARGHFWPVGLLSRGAHAHSPQVQCVYAPSRLSVPSIVAWRTNTKRQTRPRSSAGSRPPLPKFSGYVEVEAHYIYFIQALYGSDPFLRS